MRWDATLCVAIDWECAPGIRGISLHVVMVRFVETVYISRDSFRRRNTTSVMETILARLISTKRKCNKHYEQRNRGPGRLSEQLGTSFSEEKNLERT